tara:strand:+ start:204 stop:1844 length:1641 start_codon:yes stop_codon:yes gene_type:complete
MSQINQLLESAAGSYKNLQSDAARLSSKWDKTGLLEGLKNEAEKNNMSMILENQAKQLVTEISADGGAPAPAGAASFSANVGTGAQWAGIALPLVRKVFGQIAAKEFVSVQPMNLPSGLVFYLDFQYGSTKNSDTNTSPERFTAGDSLYGGSDTPFSTDGNAGEGLYGPGRFGYSMNSQSNGDLIFSAATASWKDVGFDSDLSASVAADEVIKITFANANTQLVQPDLESIRGWAFVSASAVSGGQVNAYNTALGNTVTMYVSGAEGTIANGTTGTVYYGTQPEDNTLGDFENTSAIPEINIGMRSEAIVAKTRKLKAVWTPEFAQDLNAYQSLDAEAEVTNIMSEYISLEIDSEILAMLIQDASAGTEYWSAQNNRFYVSGDDFTNDTNGYFNTQGQWFQTLGTKVNKLSNEIHRLTLRGGANFMVVSPTVSTILESIPGFAADNSDAEKMEYAFGIQKAGSFNGRYKVYKNPYMKENTVLLGYRGSQFLESGAVFAPYVPLIMTPLVYDPDTFVPRKGLLTRYAKKMLRPEFYGKIYISGLNTL